MCAGVLRPYSGSWWRWGASCLVCRAVLAGSGVALAPSPWALLGLSHYHPTMEDDLNCLRCGANGLEQGYLLDSGDSASGDTRWVEGPVERNWAGHAKLKNKRVWHVVALRCPRCSHLELLAPASKD